MSIAAGSVYKAESGNTYLVTRVESENCWVKKLRVVNAGATSSGKVKSSIIEEYWTLLSTGPLSKLEKLIYDIRPEM